MQKEHESFMRRAFQLAQKGRYTVAPNPKVGAVISLNEKLIGEGYHHQLGQAHAEVNAINSVNDPSQLAKATLYVNLEPCAHYGKTPPCVDLILRHRIPKVIIANRDPFRKVDGKGIEKLREKGVEVIVGLLQSEGREINRRFFTFHEKKRPYIILKFAKTIDNFMARTPDDADQGNWITSEVSKQMVHLWRTEEQAILVGKNTVVQDDPQLTAREVHGRNPIRLVIDPNLELSAEKKIFNGEAKTLLLNQQKSEKGQSTEWVKLKLGDHFIEELNSLCYERGILSILVEGGAAILHQFIEANCWDEARVFEGSIAFKNGLKAPQIDQKYLLKKEACETDSLAIYRNFQP